MESRKLCSMVDYVLEQEKAQSEKTRPIHSYYNMVNYAKFLSMPLTLGMFVPTDENNNVLQEPNNHGAFYAGMSSKDFNYNVMDCEQYSEALSNVIFEGWVYNSELMQINNAERDYIFNIEALSAYNVEFLTYRFKQKPLFIISSAINKYQI